MRHLCWPHERLGNCIKDQPDQTGCDLPATLLLPQAVLFHPDLQDERTVPQQPAAVQPPDLYDQLPQKLASLTCAETLQICDTENLTSKPKTSISQTCLPSALLGLRDPTVCRSGSVISQPTGFSDRFFSLAHIKNTDLLYSPLKALVSPACWLDFEPLRR